MRRSLLLALPYLHQLCVGTKAYRVSSLHLVFPYSPYTQYEMAKPETIKESLYCFNLNPKPL